MNVKRKVLLFNIYFLLLLIAATFLFEWKPNIISGDQRPISIVSDIKKDSLQLTTTSTPTKTDALTTTKNNVVIRNYTTAVNLVNASGNQYALQGFLQKLTELKKKKRKKIRIAYFGDSMIEGDLITEDLRRELQDMFGGSGVGFVPVTSVVAGFRQTVTESFSDDWKDVNFKSDNKSSANLFISGHSFFGAPNSWVSYSTVKHPHLDSFSNVSILYGAPTAGSTTTTSLVINGQKQPITANESFNILDYKAADHKKMLLGISSSDIPLYGAAFEADSGIYIDNFSFRGITGVEYKYFTDDFLKQVQSKRPYDLLVFQYGPNLLFKPDLTDFSWYQKMMLPVLKKIRAAFPETDILIISTADKGANYQGEWHTSKGVKPLIDVQYYMAQNTNSDFLNLYNAMGGEDAMVHWVEGDTTYANKDYTHVNFRGGKRLADIIFNSIIKEYYEFEKHTN